LKRAIGNNKKFLVACHQQRQRQNMKWKFQTKILIDWFLIDGRF
jgi:hypothetical protein